MIRASCLSLLLVLPALAQAQVVNDAPRSVVGFDQWTGYDIMPAERHGTTANPAPHEMGIALLTHMFRNVCLGIERGQNLDVVTPPGFSAVESNVHLMGAEPTGQGPMVLSPTGDVEADDENGHPWFYLSDHASGMTCQLEWQLPGGFEADRRVAAADILDFWFPYQMALVPADRPLPRPVDQTRNFTEWDRACVGKWCPTTVNYNLERGTVMLSTVLNITSIEGTRP